MTTTRDAGRALHLQLRGELLTAADTDGVVTFCDTRSTSLAERYMTDFPGLQVVDQHHGVVRLLRAPRRLAGGVSRGGW